MFPPSHSRTLDPNSKPYSERNKKKKGVEKIDEKFTSKHGGAAAIEWQVIGGPRRLWYLGWHFS
ncbi:hypothetical protein M6B38_351140 [Iris pallida]|uniref:Uncharacterized protein n=1 Tax=Iris pallida TaxID=29817 RepID=A0AAX6GQY8_IRIPA|nr:hypothetical protein M6B38_351140 [Iris pallida]